MWSIFNLFSMLLMSYQRILFNSSCALEVTVFLNYDNSSIFSVVVLFTWVCGLLLINPFFVLISLLFRLGNVFVLRDEIYHFEIRGQNYFQGSWYMFYTIQGRRGIEPKTGLNPFLKTALNVFCMHKTDFFSRIIFLYLIQYIGGYNRKKTRRPRIQF